MSIWPFIVLPLCLAYLWLITGALLGMWGSFPLAETASTYAQTGQVRAHGFKCGVIWHALAWPWARKGCKRAANGLHFGHWCRFVTYPDGHYTLDQMVNAAVYRDLAIREMTRIYGGPQ